MSSTNVIDKALVAIHNKKSPSPTDKIGKKWRKMEGRKGKREEKEVEFHILPHSFFSLPFQTTLYTLAKFLKFISNINSWKD